MSLKIFFVTTQNANIPHIQW